MGQSHVFLLLGLSCEDGSAHTQTQQARPTARALLAWEVSVVGYTPDGIPFVTLVHTLCHIDQSSESALVNPVFAGEIVLSLWSLL